MQKIVTAKRGKVVMPSGKEARKELHKKLFDFAEYFTKCANFMSAEYYMRIMKGMNFKKDNEKGTIDGNEIYHSAASNFPELYTPYITSLNQKLRGSFSGSGGTNIRYYKAAPPFFRRTTFFTKDKAFKLFNSNGKWYIIIPFYGRKSDKEDKGVQLEVEFGKSQQAELKEMLDSFNEFNDWKDKMIKETKDKKERSRLKDEYREENLGYLLGNATVTYNDMKRAWFVSISYTKWINDEYKPERCLGIDVGKVRALQLALSDAKIYTKPSQKDDNKGFAVEAFDVIETRRRIESRRKQIQYSYKVSGRIGHGRKNAIDPVLELREKYQNFKDRKNWYFAEWIVKEALRFNACVALENLGGFNSSESPLKEWQYSEMQAKIEYMCKKNGIPVVIVEGAYTSQECPACGHTHKENKKEPDLFVCKKCGYRAMPAYAAARIVAKRGWQQYQQKN